MITNRLGFACVAVALLAARTTSPAGAAPPGAAAPAVAPTATPADEASISPRDGKIVLFDGSHLDDWYTWLGASKYADPKGVFQVRDGVLRVSGEELGYIATRRSYHDYHLVFDFKWGKRTWAPRTANARDSGLLVHAVGPDGFTGAWMPSIEANIIEGATGEFIMVMTKGMEPTPFDVSLTCEVRREQNGDVVWEKGGGRDVFGRKNRKHVNPSYRDPDWKDALGFRGPRDLEKPVGEWNTMEVICQGPLVRVILNDQVVNEGFDAAPRSGRILLQSECAEVFFRNIELRPIGGRHAEPPVP
jgi:hypothetical protein